VADALLERDPSESLEELVRASEARRASPIPWRRRRRAIAALVVLVTSIIMGAYFASRPWHRYTFKASSVAPSYREEGPLNLLQAAELVVQTKTENGPWVEVDLQKTRKVGAVVLRNRHDCCQDRGVPMVVELADEDRQWTVVASRNKKFDTWKARFTPTEARYVRIRSTARTAIGLREIQIR
jgi:hypothetical protein